MWSINVGKAARFRSVGGYERICVWFLGPDWRFARLFLGDFGLATQRRSRSTKFKKEGRRREMNPQPIVARVQKKVCFEHIFFCLGKTFPARPTSFDFHHFFQKNARWSGKAQNLICIFSFHWLCLVRTASNRWERPQKPLEIRPFCTGRRTPEPSPHSNLKPLERRRLISPSGFRVLPRLGSAAPRTAQGSYFLNFFPRRLWSIWGGSDRKVPILLTVERKPKKNAFKKQTTWVFLKNIYLFNDCLWPSI